MKLKQNKQSKLVIALSAVILLLVALSATLTFAYFTDTKTQTDGSEVSFGTLKIDATNLETVKFVKASSDTCEAVKLVPGCTIGTSAKIKVLTSDTNIKAYIRIKVTIEGEATFTPNDLSGNWAIAENDTATLGDGAYVYYVEKVTNADEIDFSTLSFVVDTDNDNSIQGTKLTFKLTVEAIQAGHIGSDGGALDFTGASTAAKKAAVIKGASAWDNVQAVE